MTATTNRQDLQEGFDNISIPLLGSVEFVGALSTIAERIGVDFPQSKPTIEEAWTIILANINEATVRVKDYLTLREMLDRVAVAAGITPNQRLPVPMQGVTTADNARERNASAPTERNRPAAALNRQQRRRSTS